MRFHRLGSDDMKVNLFELHNLIHIKKHSTINFIQYYFIAEMTEGQRRYPAHECNTKPELQTSISIFAELLIYKNNK